MLLYKSRSREVAKNLTKISRFLKKDDYLIMTIKLIYIQKKIVEKIGKILETVYKIIDIKWLLSNSKNERTLCAICKS